MKLYRIFILLLCLISYGTQAEFSWNCDSEQQSELTSFSDSNCESCISQIAQMEFEFVQLTEKMEHCFSGFLGKNTTKICSDLVSKYYLDAYDCKKNKNIIDFCSCHKIKSNNLENDLKNHKDDIGLIHNTGLKYDADEHFKNFPNEYLMYLSGIGNHKDSRYITEERRKYFSKNVADDYKGFYFDIHDKNVRMDFETLLFNNAYNDSLCSKVESSIAILPELAEDEEYQCIFALGLQSQSNDRSSRQHKRNIGCHSRLTDLINKNETRDGITKKIVRVIENFNFSEAHKYKLRRLLTQQKNNKKAVEKQIYKPGIKDLDTEKKLAFDNDQIKNQLKIARQKASMEEKIFESRIEFVRVKKARVNNNLKLNKYFSNNCTTTECQTAKQKLNNELSSLKTEERSLKSDFNRTVANNAENIAILESDLVQNEYESGNEKGPDTPPQTTVPIKRSIKKYSRNQIKNTENKKMPSTDDLPVHETIKKDTKPKVQKIHERVTTADLKDEIDKFNKSFFLTRKEDGILPKSDVIDDGDNEKKEKKKDQKVKSTTQAYTTRPVSKISDFNPNQMGQIYNALKSKIYEQKTRTLSPFSMPSRGANIIRSVESPRSTVIAHQSMFEATDHQTTKTLGKSEATRALRNTFKKDQTERQRIFNKKGDANVGVVLTSIIDNNNTVMTQTDFKKLKSNAINSNGIKGEIKGMTLDKEGIIVKEGDNYTLYRTIKKEDGSITFKKELSIAGKLTEELKKKFENIIKDKKGKKLSDRAKHAELLKTIYGDVNVLLNSDCGDLMGHHFYFHAHKENEKPHVYVQKTTNGKQSIAKFSLSPIMLIREHNMEPTVVRDLQIMLRSKRSCLMTKWNEPVEKLLDIK